jgi:hypothetical protein
MNRVSRNWKAFLALAFVAGALLRFVTVQDMEYKEDEQINFVQSQRPLSELSASGMPSGVYLKNPGMSVWVFNGLAKITRAETPTELATAVRGFSLLGIFLLLVFVLKQVSPLEREPWLWAVALSLVNPFTLLYQRKLWPEPFLPFFCVLFLMAFWSRRKKSGAFFWGLLAPLLGFFLVALWDDRGSKTVPWRFWILGSALGSLPLIAWFIDVLQSPSASGQIMAGAQEAIQLKYWVFWISDSLGIHLGNTLGIHRGNAFAQVSEFIRYPLFDGAPTYIVGFAHLAILVTLLAAAVFAWRYRKRRQALALSSNTRLALIASFGVTGLLLTVTTVVIRRYYLSVTFPFEFLFLSLLFLQIPKVGRKLLAVIWVAELVISAGFIYFVHVNQGATDGDYGDAYHVILKRGQTLVPNSLPPLSSGRAPKPSE